MNYRILFFVIALSILLMGSILFFVVSAGAKHAQEEVLRQQEHTDLGNPVVTKGIFSLGQPAFLTQPHSCAAPFLDQAYVNVHLEYHRVPDSCNVFVNGKYKGTHRGLQPDCIGQCPYGEFSRTLPLQLLDVRDEHQVRICCNDICIEQTLAPQCAPAES